MADARRVVEVFEQALRLAGSERESFVRSVRNEDAELGNGLDDLLRHHESALTETGSFIKRLTGQFGSEADPRISLEQESMGSDFTSDIVQRLARRGETYGRYRLKGEVSRGGQGAILRVWDEDLRRNLAMKVVLGKGDPSTGETPDVDSKALGRFLEEAQVTGQLDHPGIVPVHELGLDHHGQVYFTMKLVRGRDLKTILDLVHAGREGWTQTRALNVLLKVCESMGYAHSKGVIHRDLKPANVMVGKFGEVYVMDWGLARVREREDAKDIRIKPPTLPTSEVRSERRDMESADSPLITMDGDVVGTPAYMPPEQARGELDAIGPHSDVYSVGAMLYQLLAGHAPYVPQGARLNNYAVWARVQEGPPAALSEAAPGAPEELVAICEKAMSRSPEERYADMQEMGQDLRGFQESGVVMAYRPRWPRRLARHWERSPFPARAAAGLLVFGVIGIFIAIRLELAGADLSERTILNLAKVPFFGVPLLVFASLFVGGRPKLLAWAVLVVYLLLLLPFLPGIVALYS